MYSYSADLWKTHPVLKKGWRLVTKSLKNKKKYGWEAKEYGAFATEDLVFEFLQADTRKGRGLAKMLIGPYCDTDIKKCTKPYMEDGNPYKDIIEAFIVQYELHKKEEGRGAAMLDLYENNKLIIENHRKNRKVHPIAKKQWWYNA